MQQRFPQPQPHPLPQPFFRSHSRLLSRPHSRPLKSLARLTLGLGLSLLLIQCGRTGKVGSGHYEVADQEYSSQNYSMQRQLTAQGGFEEKHVVDHCLLMEMTGKWEQKGGTLTLRYDQIRNRATCHDSLGAWAVDTSQLIIPIRNVDGTSYESLLAASGGKPEKWIKWLKTE